VLQIGEDTDCKLFTFVNFVSHYERDVLYVQLNVLVAIFLRFQLLSELLNTDIFFIQLQLQLSRIDIPKGPFSFHCVLLSWPVHEHCANHQSLKVQLGYEPDEQANDPFDRLLKSAQIPDCVQYTRDPADI
jgi:hypothetical protein